jgi:hypothetical protein
MLSFFLLIEVYHFLPQKLTIVILKLRAYFWVALHFFDFIKTFSDFYKSFIFECLATTCVVFLPETNEILDKLPQVGFFIVENYLCGFEN